MEYEQVVNSCYESAYRLAFSLARNPDDAAELTQETFARLLAKGGQLRDHSKVQAWLFTTLYRIFIGWKRRETNLPHFEISTVERELPVTPAALDQLDGHTVLNALLEIDQRYRAPLMLFYLEDLCYREIAAVLGIPAGTVMSRISRGKNLVRWALANPDAGQKNKIVPLDVRTRKRE